MKAFVEELEEVVDKHVKSPQIQHDEIVYVIKDFMDQLGCPQAAIAVCLMAIGNLSLKSQRLCKEHGLELEFDTIMGDPVIKLLLPFAYQVMACKRFK